MTNLLFPPTFKVACPNPPTFSDLLREGETLHVAYTDIYGGEYFPSLIVYASWPEKNCSLRSYSGPYFSVSYLIIG